MSDIWIDLPFPEFDVIGKGQLVYGATQAAPLGCMTGFINNIAISCQMAYFTRKGRAITYSDPVNGALGTAVGKYRLNKEQKDSIFSRLADRYTQPFIFMAERINWGTPMSPLRDGAWYIPLRTQDFAEWLAENKVGILVTSPVGRNPNHTANTDFSIVQGYIWTPPKALQYVLPDTEQVFRPDYIDRQTWVDSANEASRRAAYGFEWKNLDWEGWKQKAFLKSTLFKKIWELK